jgi:hypothetical protein
VGPDERQRVGFAEVGHHRRDHLVERVDVGEGPPRPRLGGHRRRVLDDPVQGSDEVAAIHLVQRDDGER